MGVPKLAAPEQPRLVATNILGTPAFVHPHFTATNRAHARDQGVQTDHTVLSSRNLESEAILRMNAAFEVRMREVRQKQKAALRKVTDEEEASKAKYQLLYEKLMDRLLQQSDGSGKTSYLSTVRDPAEFIKGLVQHMMTCKKMEAMVTGG